MATVQLADLNGPKWTSSGQNGQKNSELFAIGPVQLADPGEWPKIGLLNRGYGRILSIFPRKDSKTQNFLSSDCRNPGGKGCGFIPLLNNCPTGVPGKAMQA